MFNKKTGRHICTFVIFSLGKVISKPVLCCYRYNLSNICTLLPPLINALHKEFAYLVFVLLAYFFVCTKYFFLKVHIIL